MLLAWLTDIHLNFLAPPEAARFLDEVNERRPDAILLGGDIAEAHNLIGFLRRIGEAAHCPVYFVLGNHDFYHGAIHQVRDEVQQLCQEVPRLSYLTRGGVVRLTPSLALIGHDGWADARLGDYENSTVMLNDYMLIHELRGMSQRARRAHLEALGDEAAAHVRRLLPEALAACSRVILLTHVPPLREACWHEGRTSDDEWLPHFTCQAVGQALLEIMPHWPDRQLTVLCGHTHSSGETRPLPNLHILTGRAIYGQPQVQKVWEE